MNYTRFILELQPGVFFVAVSNGIIPHWTSHVSQCLHFVSESLAEKHKKIYEGAFPNARVIGVKDLPDD